MLLPEPRQPLAGSLSLLSARIEAPKCRLIRFKP